jgi:phospholipase D1/2
MIVIDDVLAFCGGIDATADRWDTRDHPDHSPYRVRPTRKRHHGPWHDASVAVGGDAAHALGDLVRTRWEHATGETIEPPPTVLPIWPEGLGPMLRDAEVAISRTMPAHAGRDEVHEIESLYLAIIAATRRTLYIESQGGFDRSSQRGQFARRSADRPAPRLGFAIQAIYEACR